MACLVAENLQGETREARLPRGPRAAECARVIGAESWEDRGLSERCLVGFNSGPPIVPASYNQNIQIFQASDHVVILHEMVHDARIVPLDGRTRLPEDSPVDG
jgi:hypothetical protein